MNNLIYMASDGLTVLIGLAAYVIVFAVLAVWAKYTAGIELLNSFESESPTTRFEEHQSSAEIALEAAATHKKRGNFDSVLNKYNEAISEYQEALDAIDAGSTDHSAEIKGFTNKTRDKLNEIKEEKQAYQTINDKLNTITEKLDKAVENQATKASESSEQHIDTAEELLEEAISTADEYEFDKLGDVLAEKKERCVRIKEQPQTSIPSAHERSQTSANLLNKRPQTSTPLANVPTSPQLSLTYDDIEKNDPIGSGGNADVYRATATTDSGEFTLAIKEPRVSGTIDTDTMDQLVNEAETWQQLDDHDYIVSVVDYGSTPLPWIGMEYMDGGDLSERAGELSFEQAIWTALSITRGIRYAHKRGVAHLDLKPTNILFRSVENEWDVPKIADWGLSKHLLQHSQSIEGMSPQYAAPEQLAPEQFGTTDTVTDVYQLGTVLYELFTGKPQFSGNTYQVMNKIQSTAPTSPSERADIPTEIDDVLLTALAKERQDRYDDVIYLRDALESLWEDYR